MLVPCKRVVNAASYIGLKVTKLSCNSDTKLVSKLDNS